MFEQGLRGRLSSPSHSSTNNDEDQPPCSSSTRPNVTPTSNAKRPLLSPRQQRQLFPSSSSSPSSVHNERKRRWRERRNDNTHSTRIFQLLVISLSCCCLWLFSNHVQRSKNPLKGAAILGGDGENGDIAPQSRGENEELEFDWEKGDIVHIVNTNFMYKQAHLLELGKAKLELFRTFCLPTMATQKSAKFIWIVWTDPNLDDFLQTSMIKLLAPYPNFLLIASNNDQPEDFQYVEAMPNIQNTVQVWSGNKALLQRAYDLSQTRVVLETLLDASDGLHTTYIEKLQLEAGRYLMNKEEDSSVVSAHQSDVVDGEISADKVATAMDNTRWRIWCPCNHIEWHAQSPFPSPPIYSNETSKLKAHENNNQSPHGYLTILQVEQCISSGMTFGYGVGVSRTSIPQTTYQNFHSDLPPCGKQKTSCLRRMEKLAPAMIHPFTPASSLMGDNSFDLIPDKNVVEMAPFKTKYKEIAQRQGGKEAQDMMWKGLGFVMHVMKDDVIRLKKFMEGLDLQIAKEISQTQYQ